MNKILNILLTANTILSLTIMALLKLEYITYGTKIFDEIIIIAIISILLLLFFIKLLFYNTSSNTSKNISAFLIVAISIFLIFFLLAGVERLN